MRESAYSRARRRDEHDTYYPVRRAAQRNLYSESEDWKGVLWALIALCAIVTIGVLLPIPR